MKIAWFANIDFQEGNAANARIRCLANGLKKNGNQIFLFLLSPTIFNSNRINKKSKGFFDGLYFNYLSGTSSRSQFLIVRFFNYSLAVFNSSVLLFKKRKYFDIIFLYNPRFLFFWHIYLISKLLGIPLIIEKTELDETVLTKNFFYKFIRLTDKLDAYLLKYICFHLFVISDNLRDHFKNYFPENKITKIPIVVDLSRFELQKQNGIFYTIGYLGSFAPKDGVKNIIKSFKDSLEYLPHLRMKLIGFNPNRKEINLELKKHLLNGQVEKSGQITYNQVPIWLSKCDLLVLNRTNDKYSHYGFPTKLGEYLATGIPTICSKVGNIELYLEHNKNTYFIEPDNPANLTAAIIARYKNYDDFNKMGENGKLVVKEEFDYEKFIPTILHVFESTIKIRY